MPAVKETQLRYLEYLHREDGYRHHRYDEEMLQYHLLREGDQAAVPESVRMWTSGKPVRTPFATGNTCSWPPSPWPAGRPF